MFSSFFNSLFKKKYIALPARQYFLKTFQAFKNEEAILSTFCKFCSKGSLTIEATIILPFFLLLLYSISFFINIIGLQLTLQMHLEETARKINSSAYLLEDTFVSESDLSKDDIFENTISDFVYNQLNNTLLQNLFLTDNIKTLCDTFIYHGSKGISLHHSVYDKDTQSLDIIITYSLKIPFFSDAINHLSFAQKCHFKLWNGLFDNTTLSESNPFVYVTKYGRVYHTDKYCSYLIKYSNIIPFSELEDFCTTHSRNLNPCSFCTNMNFITQKSLIYITKTGNVYHLSKDCYHLSSDICQCRKNSVSSSLQPCSKCTKNDSEENS